LRGTITLLRSSRLPTGIEPSPLMGWDGLALGGVEVYELPTYFNTALSERNVEILARELRDCIDRRQDVRVRQAGGWTSQHSELPATEIADVPSEPLSAD
jgi:hypothetical protein